MAAYPDVVVVGSCMIDLICYAPRLPKAGETLRGTDFKNGFGGKGCNQCVAAKKLGADCLLVARIGNDSFGRNYLEKIKEYEMPTKFIQMTEGVSTGMAQITVAETGENQIVIVSGANDRMSVADLEKVKDEIENCKVLLTQLEIPEMTTIEALKLKAKSKKGKSILNAAPAQANLNPVLFTLPDIFCVNETEAELITGKRVSSTRDAEEAVKALVGKGCKEVIITLGEKGAFHGKAGDPTFSHVPTPVVNAIDTTGAGDAFLGSFAFFASTCPEASTTELILKANKVSAMSVQRLGTQESFPFFSDIPREFL